MLEVELAALPGDSGEASGESGAQAWVVIGDDEGDTVEAAVLEGGEEVAPVDFGFGESDADADNGAFAIGADADGDEDGAGEHGTIDADFFVASIQSELGKGLGIEAT